MPQEVPRRPDLQGAPVSGSAFLLAAVLIFGAANAVVRKLSEIGAQHLVDGRNFLMLQPDRASRMVAQYAVDQALPGLGEVIDKLVKATFDAATSGTYEAEVRRATERVLVDRVMWLASAAQNAQVRAISSYKLQRLATRLRAEVGRTEGDVAAHTLLAADIKRFLEQMVARDAEWMHNDPNHSDCDRMNADSHLRALLLGHNLTLQVSGGEVVLGQWQRILMAELDGPRARSLRIQIFGIS